MLKKLFAILFLFVGISAGAWANTNPKPNPPDEGMWIPLLISQNFEEMRKLGLQLTPEQLYAANKSSLKDAIVWFDGGCTAEIISDKGLVLTNHHCGYGNIQQLSSIEHNYLQDGFWAKTHAEELECPTLFVRFLVRIDDVTKRMQDKVGGMSGMERAQAEQMAAQQIVGETTKDNGYFAEVKPMYYGGEYYLYVYETYNDVRLVGTPPESVGKFGGDTDNWMWPRHTGDFSMFRVYMSPDGKPAEYSPNNVPLKPKHFLPVSTAGVKDGDYTMILGYPGRTERYLTSSILQQKFDYSNQAYIDLRGIRLDLWKEFMDADQSVRLKYASKYARVSNYHKFFIGQNKGLKRLHTIPQKQADEQKFMQWVNADPKRKSKYGEVLNNTDVAVQEFNKYVQGFYYFLEAGRAPEIITLALQFRELETLLNSKAATATATEALKTAVEAHFKDYHKPADRRVLAAMYKKYAEVVPLDQQPKLFKEIKGKYKGDYQKWADMIFDKSMFDDQAALTAFLKAPNLKTLQKDPAFKTALDMQTTFVEKLYPAYMAYQMAVAENLRLYVEGMREMNPTRKFYPDANSCMRLTYGVVKAYDPADGVAFSYRTTAKGLSEKFDPLDPEFVMPEKLMELVGRKDFGRWAENGELPVCFIHTTDITGGNSGSPVINGKGEIIGLAFDGNWEAMTGDLVYDKELKRTISVDIRYVLFIIDKLCGADNIIRELKLVN